MRAVDHLQENELTAERQHALLPIVGIALAFLEYPVVRRDLARENAPIHIELPNLRLLPRAKLLLEDVVPAWVLATLHSLHLLFCFAA